MTIYELHDHQGNLKVGYFGDQNLKTLSLIKKGFVMTAKNNEAIILLTTPYNSNTPHLAKDILKACKSNDLSVI